MHPLRAGCNGLQVGKCHVLLHCMPIRLQEGATPAPRHHLCEMFRGGVGRVVDAGAAGGGALFGGCSCRSGFLVQP
jgi:hypothetical protein